MMSLVDDTFRESRSIRDARRMVGKAEKSSGRSMNNVTVKISIARPNEAASPTSKTHAGTGNIIMTMTAIKARASKTWLNVWVLLERRILILVNMG